MLPPAVLSGDCCATVRTVLHLPTSDAATPLAFAPSQLPLVSFHSCRHARPASAPNAAGHCPLQTDPECGALPAPAACADTDLLPCRCTSARKEIRICARCWCRERTTFWVRLERTVTCGVGG